MKRPPEPPSGIDVSAPSNAPPPADRLDAWCDGASVQIIAISTFGDPMDCSAREARELAGRILQAAREADEEPPSAEAISVTPKLQALRIPAGWQVVHNALRAVEPPTEEATFSAVAHYFHEDLLHLFNEARSVSLRVDWHPNNDHQGSYRLRVIRSSSPPADSPSPEAVITTYETRVLSLLVEQLETWTARPS